MFLWSSCTVTNGAQCHVAWDRVCLSKRDGGLGIRQLNVQNAFLLLKLLHRLHHPAGSSCALWAQGLVNLATLHGNVDDAHWDALRSMLSTYRKITLSVLISGAATTFWEDHWHESCSLSEAFPALYSHVRTHDTSVDQVATHGICRFLVPLASRQLRPRTWRLSKLSWKASPSRLETTSVPVP